jgi:DsbC/DsbD-like thiol-disulfide interchange protein
VVAKSRVFAKRSLMKKLRALCLASVFAFCGLAFGQEYQGVTLIEPSILADSETLAPGEPVTVAIRLSIADGWHTYWENPGDSGIPARVVWDVPEGVRVGPMQWPVPQRLVEPGNLQVYAFKDEVVLLARLFVAPGLDLDEVTLKASADWLVCRESCIPGETELTLTLPVADEVVPANRDLFAEYRQRLPQRLALDPDNGLKTDWKRDGNTLYLLLAGVPEGSDLKFFPLPGTGVLTGHSSPVDSWSGDGEFEPEYVLSIPLEASPAGLDRLRGVLVVSAEGEESTGWLF